MSTLISPSAERTEEAVRRLPGGSEELVSAATTQSPSTGAPRRAKVGAWWLPPPREDLVDAAYEVARKLDGCWTFSQRLSVYREVGERFKSDARRVLNIAAARWPEMIPMLNDLPEWKALLSADLD
ncbi:MAG TPA: hypothetical protein VFN18_10965 [Solirubrobacterales bacterium]|nr:hypothetical protein [Solirubrobacterales bacterium]